MTMVSKSVSILILLSALVPAEVMAQNEKVTIPDNFARENLIAWCVVPFDSKERSPRERAEMLAELGFKRCAYDWRERHVATFEEEIIQYRKNGIEYVAFWGKHARAYELFRKHDLKPAIWQMLGDPAGDTQEEKLSNAIEALKELVEETSTMKCKLGLYNHGGWGGEPANLVAICEAFKAKGHDHVGIIYNFHHGHGDIAEFKTRFELMLPFLQCVNLNGMVDLSLLKTEQKKREQKIKPIGSGQFERQMIRTVISSGYTGPIGVLGHVHERDVREVLTENLEGLEFVFGSRDRPEWLTKLQSQK